MARQRFIYRGFVRALMRTVYKYLESQKHWDSKNPDNAVLTPDLVNAANAIQSRINTIINTKS